MRFRDNIIAVVIILTLSCIPFLILRWKNNQYVSVSTNSGDVMGLRKTVNQNCEIKTWLSIPFAEPPLKSLRFKKPVPVKPWHSPKFANQYPNVCFQFRAEQNKLAISEDCLYLNIFGPKDANSTADKAVLLFIHGGSFQFGSSSGISPDVLVCQENVIVVTIQYRLGVFGFLASNGKEKFANAGLFDQSLAIKWVKENIIYFGGDADRITIFGFSSGAASSGFHLFYPGSQDLFKNVIMLSGSPLAIWSLKPINSALELGRKLSEKVGCGDTYPSNEAIQCLREKNPKDLIGGTNCVKNLCQIFYFPTIDGDFLLDHPKNMMAKGSFKKTNIMEGTNKYEAMQFLSSWISYDSGVAEISKESFISAFRTLTKLPEQLLGSILKFYTSVEDLTDGRKNVMIMETILDDVGFFCPSLSFLHAASRQNSVVYKFSFEYTGSSKNWLQATHSSSVLFAFGMVWTYFPDDHESLKISRMMMKYIANFAKTGNPNKPTVEKLHSGNTNVSWLPFNSAKPNALIIDKQSFLIPLDKKFQNSSCIFWDRKIPVSKSHLLWIYKSLVNTNKRLLLDIFVKLSILQYNNEFDLPF